MKMTFRIIFLLASLTLTISARQAYTVRPSLAISLTPDNAEVRAGSNVCVQVGVTNNSSQDLVLGGGAGGYTTLDPNYRFEVHDQSGSLIQPKAYPHPELFRSRLYDYILKPNETYSQDQCVSARYDLRKPGRYTIQVFRSATSNARQGEEIASNIVSVTVLPVVAGKEPAFNIVVAPLKSSFKTGSDVCIGISFTNNSVPDLGTTYAAVNGITNEFRWEIRDETGKLIPKKSYPYPQPGSFQGSGGGALKPNETEVREECPSRRYDMSKAGKYTIQAFRSVPSDGEIGSNIVDVTVVP